MLSCYQSRNIITFQSPINNRLPGKIIGYNYNSVNVITFDVAQSDHIKWLLVYLSILFFKPKEIPQSPFRNQISVVLISEWQIMRTYYRYLPFESQGISTYLFLEITIV